MAELRKQDLHVPVNPVRFVTAAALFDGHDAAINIMRRIIQSTGAEVIHLGHNRSVDEIVTAAIQEDVQGIAISSYQGGHVEYFKYAIDLLRERGAASWAAAVSHPMVAEIGAGSLPHETFRYYFEQNVLYLEDYARAIALIIGRAPDLAGITVLTRFLGQIVDVEIPANLAFLTRLGGSAASLPDFV